jgi:hypothetical protein
LSKAHLDIVERPFKDGRITSEIEVLRKKADLAKQIMEMSQYAVKIRNDHIQFLFGPEYSTIHPFPTKIDNYRVNNVETSSTSDTKQTPSGTQTDGSSVWDGMQKVPTITTSKSITSGTTSGSQTSSKSIGQIINPDYKSDYDLQVQLDNAIATYIDASLVAESAEKNKQDAQDKISLERAAFG